MAASDHLNTDQHGEQLSLFDVAPYTTPEPRMDYDPAAWLQRPDVSFHSSEAPQMPQEGESHTSNFGVGFHHGSVQASMDRGRVTSTSHISSDDYNYFSQRPYIHPVRMTGETKLRQEPQKTRAPGLVPGEKESDESYQSNLRYHESTVAHPLTFSDSEANFAAGTATVNAGEHLPYVNAAEDIGSISFRSPRGKLSTWAEDVAADPGASRHHKLLAEQFDLTVPVRENWSREVLGTPRGRYKETAWGGYADMGEQTPHARNLPESLSGEVTEQPTLSNGLISRMGESALGGSSKLPILTPKLKKKGRE